MSRSDFILDEHGVLQGSRRLVYVGDTRRSGQIALVAPDARLNATAARHVAALLIEAAVRVEAEPAEFTLVEMPKTVSPAGCA